MLNLVHWWCTGMFIGRYNTITFWWIWSFDALFLTSQVRVCRWREGERERPLPFGLIIVDLDPSGSAWPLSLSLSLPLSLVWRVGRSCGCHTVDSQILTSLSSQSNLVKYFSLIRNIFNLTKLKLSFSGKDIFREKVSKVLRRLLMFLN